MIRFDARTQVVISEDLRNDLLRILTEENIAHAALFVDSNIISQDIIKNLTEFLKSKGSINSYHISSREPTTDMVNEYARLLTKDKKADMLIGIGGGSIIDLMKAVSVMAVNEGRVEEYHGTGKRFISGIKKIAVPTTSGTGSEVTAGAVLVNRKTKFKRALSGRCIAPDYAVLNPYLTLSMPDNVIAFTGLDALGHAVESYTAKCANIVTRMYSKQAFSLIYNNLPKVFNDRQNIELRKNMLLGSCLAGYAIYNSNTGAAHSMAYPLGIYNDVPHGLAVAKLLPKVVKKNVENGCYLYAGLYELIDGMRPRNDGREEAELFSKLLNDYEPLKYVNKNFADYGIDETNYEFLAERGMDLISALNNNPVEFGLQDAKNILKAAITH
ncbi:MAG: iron-containing alcohol dehydrogenase [Candidatus Omnitrophota bacterium]|nr:iron-containing alcohol dehydrogenase [Candidatus Omnitrophota bacterium]